MFPVYAKVPSPYSATALKEIQIFGMIFSSQLLQGPYQKMEGGLTVEPQTKQAQLLILLEHDKNNVLPHIGIIQGMTFEFKYPG
jgi:hypothetical protein